MGALVLQRLRAVRLLLRVHRFAADDAAQRRRLFLRLGQARRRSLRGRRELPLLQRLRPWRLLLPPGASLCCSSRQQSAAPSKKACNFMRTRRNFSASACRWGQCEATCPTAATLAGDARVASTWISIGQNTQTGTPPPTSSVCSESADTLSRTDVHACKPT